MAWRGLEWVPPGNHIGVKSSSRLRPCTGGTLVRPPDG
jgi:hypothetical protein